ncbi:RNA polymerase sigma factor [Alteriqipengyuania lutimaris]|uniref:RNA polymerase sigma factor n=1 Tax=Alteriqipengyuania lutimaris TaxID=1538146 RepID=A0A395LHB1_9SPHN|nr:RNA polymerase sigma factor [Alteriqipengyuania lutimaris]MBB3035437.1 RNA polymerase sigma-70 factor (ECF subfamily) [Alteriqipengyuania lutimaris]RDS76011.1 RNA polymerase sigma factor [Alteriqipengyuania lutimaris]
MAHSVDPHDGLEAVFLANRDALLRFLAARGAGDDAEDILHEVWLRITQVQAGPIAAPLAYLYRAANAAMIDRYRSARQAELRDAAWSEGHGGAMLGVSDSPSAERVVAGRQFARRVEEALAELPERANRIFRRSRIDGAAQRVIAEEFGVSISTVESDLRQVYRVLVELRERLDEE